MLPCSTQQYLQNRFSHCVVSGSDEATNKCRQSRGLSSTCMVLRRDRYVSDTCTELGRVVVSSTIRT